MRTLTRTLTLIIAVVLCTAANCDPVGPGADLPDLQASRSDCRAAAALCESVECTRAMSEPQREPCPDDLKCRCIAACELRSTPECRAECGACL